MERSQSKTEVSSTAATKEGAEDTYRMHRELAVKYRKDFRECRALRKRALKVKDYGEANRLKKQMKKIRAGAKKADAVASQKIFKDENEKCVKSRTIDVHGQHPEEAIRAVGQHIETLGRSHKVVEVLVIITGQGKHSKDGVGVVKEAVIEFLRENGIPWDYFVNKGGIVNHGRIAIDLKNVCNYKYPEVKDDKGPGPVDAQRMEVMPALNRACIKNLTIFPYVRPDYRCTNKCPRIDVLDS